MTDKITEYERLLTVLRLAHLNAWDWNLKTRDLTMINTADQETMGQISPLMAQEKVTVPNYPQILIDRGIIRGNAVEMVNEYEMMIYHAEHGQEVAFRLPFTNVDGENIWLQFRGTVYRDNEGNAERGVGYYTDITRHLDGAKNGEFKAVMNVERENQRYMNMIKGLTLEYANVFLINLIDESYTVFRLNDVTNMMVRRELESRTSFKDVLAFYIQQYVVEEDREKLQCLVNVDEIRLRLREKGYFRIAYRSYRCSELVYCQVNVALGNVSDDEVVIGFRNIDQEYRLRQSLEQESRQDSLTGLLNRRAFQNDVLQGLYNEKNMNTAMIFLDLDHFKDVNDKLGHAMGDQAIADTANKLRKVFRRIDIVGRYGGDEFCIFIKDMPMHLLTERLNVCLEQLHNTYEKLGKKVEVTTSIGVAYYKECGRIDLSRIMEQADAALYEAKNSGRNRFVIKTYS